MLWHLMYISLNFILLMMALVYLLIGSMASYLIQKDFMPEQNKIWPFLDYPFVVLGILLFIPPGIVFIYRYFIAFKNYVIIYLIINCFIILAIIIFFSLSVGKTNMIIISDSMDELEGTFSLYLQEDKFAAEIFDHLHKWYHCCGLNGPGDFNKTKPVPPSCHGDVGCKDRISLNTTKDLILIHSFNLFTGLYLIGVTIYFIIYRKHEKESGVYMERKDRRGAKRESSTVANPRQ